MAALATDPMCPVPYRVTAHRADTADVATIALAPVGDALARPAPGQFVMAWAPGVGEVPISVSGVGDGGEVQLTVREVGAVSGALAGAEPRAVLGLRGPFGTSWPVAAAASRDVVVVAGGLGLAPLRLALDELALTHAPSRLTLVLGAREPAQLLYPHDLARWAAIGVEVHTTVDAADRTWHGSVGFATSVLERLGRAYDVAYVCGPELMMSSAAKALVKLGMPPGDVHVSLERNMHCGIGHCGRCQLGPLLLCRTGPVVSWAAAAPLVEVRGR